MADDFSAVPHPSIAEVANLDWFEDVRSKALGSAVFQARGFVALGEINSGRRRIGCGMRHKWRQ